MGTNCTICGIPDGNGYIISADHFEKDNLLTGGNEYQKQYNYGYYAPFTIYATTDGNFYLDSVDCMETLEKSGVDLCDNIPVDELLVRVKVTDGKCEYCKAREQQLKLF